MGLSSTDVEIYVYLSIRGHQRAKDVAEGLHLSKPKVYNSLRNLRNKEAIVIVHEQTKSFSACPLGKLLKSETRKRLDKAESFERSRQDILSVWNELMRKSDSL